jgi:hypothetical protein
MSDMRDLPAPAFPSCLRAFVPSCLACCLLIAGPAHAADHYLAIGGGAGPSNNQVSLEKNILFFRDALTTLGLNNAPQEVLFADGNENKRDVQFVLSDSDLPKVQVFLQEIFPEAESVTQQYRPHEIPGVWGPSQAQTLDRWFNTIGKNLADGDRLIIYYTGHGGPGKPPHNTTLALWNEPSMPVKRFVGLLDRLPPKVSVVLIMVQCFSGGFADVIFNQADPAKGLSPQNRCGFFATTFDRTAAGCTPDIILEDYREYSTYFWAALCGHTRTGKPVPLPDFSGNGTIELSEAHAYTMIHSETVDIPVKTSDRFLREFSKSAGPGLLASNISYDKLISLASPSDRAVLDGLSDALHLAGPNRVAAATELAGKLAKRSEALEQRKRKVDQGAQVWRDTAKEVLLNRWPELANPRSLAARKTIDAQQDRIVKMLDSSISFDHLEKQIDQSDKMNDDDTNAEKDWVKCQRFINQAESVVLAANLPKVTTKEIQARYAALVVAENMPLSATKQP